MAFKKKLLLRILSDHSQGYIGEGSFEPIEALAKVYKASISSSLLVQHLLYFGASIHTKDFWGYC